MVADEAAAAAANPARTTTKNHQGPTPFGRPSSLIVTIRAARYTAGATSGSSRYTMSRGRRSRQARRSISSHSGSPPNPATSAERARLTSKTHAPAQPRLVLSRSLATEATLLIRSDCSASALAPAIVMRYGRRRSSVSSGSIRPRASSRAITA